MLYNIPFFKSESEKEFLENKTYEPNKCTCHIRVMNLYQNLNELHYIINEQRIIITNLSETLKALTNKD